MQTFIGILIIGLLLVSSIGVCNATINYTYDNLNRLIEVDHGNGTVESYTYDAAGNRLTYVVQSSNNAPYFPSLTAPPSGSSDNSINIALIWQGGDPDAGDTVTYDVYLDSNNPPLTKVSENQAETSYLASGLAYGTTYFWKIVARDNHGAETEGSVWSFTTGGSNITVNLGNGVFVTYDNVSGSCTTSVIVRTTPDHSPPSSFYFIDGGYYDVSTNCTYSGNITITFPYNESAVSGPEGNLKVLHWESGRWVDVTVSVNTVNNTITGRVNSLSPFGIGYYSGGGGGYSTGANTSLIALLAMIAISGGFLLLRRQRGIS